MPNRGSLLVLSLIVSLPSSEALAQVYGYTNDKGVLILSNVPRDDRMQLIADGAPEETVKTWNYSGEYDELILKASRLYGVDSSLVRAVIAVESAFNRFARSHKGARGLMQLIPETGRRYGVVNAYDPWQNIRGGTAYLKEQMTEFRNLRLALAAYNAGPNAVKRYNGIPPYKETQNYVKKVLAIYRAGSKIQIVKGNSVYSIGQPGGSTRVTQFHQSGNSSLVQRTAAAPLQASNRRQKTSALGAAAMRKSAGLPNAQSRPSSGASATLRYYRFVDADGVVHITRTLPADQPHTVLRP